MIPEVRRSLGSRQRWSGGLLVRPDTGATPAAVLGELCLVHKCVPEVSLEERAAGVPLGGGAGRGRAGRGDGAAALVSCLNQGEASGEPLKARGEANVHL